jgi:putative flavoprotein involved in K+ transport
VTGAARVSQSSCSGRLGSFARGLGLREARRQVQATSQHEVLVIGGGQSGLAAGFHLRAAGLDFSILEAGATPTGSWSRCYDSLRLFSPAHASSLPGLPFPGDPARRPHRDEVVEYLREYVARHELPVECERRVERVLAADGGFEVRAGERAYRCRVLVAATGSFGNPHVPRLSGCSRFQGRVLHAADYRSPAAFRGQRVVVVGGGNSAVQIGAELAEVARTTLATRRPIRMVPQRWLGRDLHFWLRWSGFDRSRWSGARGSLVIDTGGYRRALARGRPDRRRMFERFTEDGVEWPGGERERVDAVVFATGYRPDLRCLEALGALAGDGSVPQRRGASTRVPGLYFVGLVGQTCFRSATLRGAGPDAELVVRDLRRRLCDGALNAARGARAGRPRDAA